MNQNDNDPSLQYDCFDNRKFPFVVFVFVDNNFVVRLPYVGFLHLQFVRRIHSLELFAQAQQSLFVLSDLPFVFCVFLLQKIDVLFIDVDPFGNFCFVVVDGVHSVGELLFEVFVLLRQPVEVVGGPL
jgi:hypothetical protein